ncbi:hypothetical protein B1756_17700 [Natrarchaeobaculum aegyptiacum]|uniref:Small CPxCG-related zinc finger protein n=1 Tax=Natrarchaeobaculum aegyptiacum TaxID=745377 RepID=A0A2Z2HXQ1_9EURY|nr:hypothetical protein B1756_17700 [Natrarchaeobaculum aegyptiacum]
MPEYGPGVTPCPRCGTPIEAVTSSGPLEHVASPCGCPAPGAVLESVARFPSESRQTGSEPGTDSDLDD